MATATGSNIVFGIKPAGTWGTYNSADAANMGVLAKSWNLTYTAEPLPDTSYNAQAIRRQTTNVGRIQGALTFTCDLRYEYMQALNALVFGTGGSPTLQTTGYRHTTYAPVRKTCFASIAFDNGLSVYKLNSVFFTGATFKTNAARRIEVEYRAVFDQLVLAATGSLSSLTVGGNVDYVRMGPASILTYKIGTQGGTPATIAVQDWEFAADWEVPLDDRVFTSTAAPYMDQPSTGRFNATLKLSRPRDATTYLPTGMVAGTIYEAQLDHVLTTNEKEFKIRFPSLKVASGTDNPGDYAAMREVLTLVCERDTAGASTFNVNAGPYIMNVNSINADPLAT